MTNRQRRWPASMSPRWPQGRARLLLATVLVAAVYYGGAKAGLAFAFGTQQITAIWPPTGFALAIVLLGGRRMWIGIAVGAFVANVTTDEPVLTATAIAAGNTLEALTGAWLLTRSSDFRPALERKRDVLRLVAFGAVGSTLISATIGVASLRLGGVIPVVTWHAWHTWWLGDMAGCLLVAPAILVLATQVRGRRAWRVDRWELAEAAAVFATLAVLSALVFHSDNALPYVLFPALYWISLRLGQSGAVASNVLLAAVAIWTTAHGHGPFVGGSEDANLLRAQTFVAVVALTSLLAAAVNSERERAQDELQLRERFASQLERLLESAPDAMVIVDAHGMIQLVNAQTTAVFGYERAELVGQPAELLVADHLRERHVAHRRAYQARPTARPMGSELQLRARHKDGHEFAVEVSLSPVDTPTGRLVSASVRDITARLAAETALRQLQARLQAIFDHVPAGLSLRDLDGRYLHVNQFAARMLGATPEALVGTDPREHLDPEQAARERAEDAQIVRDRRPLIQDTAITAADGLRHDFHVVRYPVLDEHGTVAAFGSFSLDITDRMRAERAREAALDDLEDAQRIAGIGSWSLDVVSGKGTWSAQLYRMFGRDPADGPAFGGALLAYVHPDDREPLAAALARASADREPFELDFRILAGDGVQRVLHGHGAPDPTEPGAYSGTAQDVTARRAAEQDLRAAEERFRNAFEHAPIGMALTGLDGRCVQVNDALCDITGYTAEQLCATSFTAITHPDDVAADRELSAALLDGSLDRYHREKRYLRASGEPVWVSMYATLLRDRDGEPQQFLRQIVDITERRQLESELRHLADHDPLTGLLNRRGLETELDRHVERVRRYGERGALLVLDLDHFKAINDTLGHNVGDQLIVSVAGVLRRRLRASDTVARLGGDEFAVLLPEADTAEAQDVAEKIVASISEDAVALHNDQTRRVSASVGVTMFTASLSSGEEALIDADLAMYDAKEAGRGRAALYASDRHDEPRMKSRLAWIERIRGALDEDRFTLHAQPIVALHSGDVHQYELLLRMADATGDIVPPGAFVYIAERFDLIQQLDAWVATRAIRLIEEQRALGRDVALEVNLSGKSLGGDHLLEVVEAELGRSRIDPSLLIFEVTETAAVANIQLASRFAERLRGLGCRFALDDFGAGFGSFYYLKHLPFDYLKIDGEFVTRCTSNRTDQLVIEALVTIAKGLQKQTIAECVEHASTELFLRRHGVDYAQGYHFGRPVPVAQALAQHSVRATTGE